MNTRISILTTRQGLHDITAEVSTAVSEAQLTEGLCTLYVQHTSASLLIQENYDSSAKYDLEQWLNRLVPEDDPLYTHTVEGPDDMPAHIKAAITPSSLSIPIMNNELMLGQWQGIFLWEHRRLPQQRHILVTLL